MFLQEHIVAEMIKTLYLKEVKCSGEQENTLRVSFVVRFSYRVIVGLSLQIDIQGCACRKYDLLGIWKSHFRQKLR